VPSSLLGEGEDMIFHFDVFETNPDNSEGSANRDLEGCGPITITDATNKPGDDAEMDVSNGDMNTSSSDLEMPYDGTEKQISGMRFDKIKIYPGATIQNAYIEFTADSNESGTTNIIFYGEDVDNASFQLAMVI